MNCGIFLLCTHCLHCYTMQKARSIRIKSDEQLLQQFILYSKTEMDSPWIFMRKWISTKRNDCVLRGVIYSICGWIQRRRFKRKPRIAKGPTPTLQMSWNFFFWFASKRAMRKLNLLREVRTQHDLCASDASKCLMLYGSCHVQGKALFMDYSISRR